MEDFRKWLLGQNADVTIEQVLEEGRKHETTINTICHIPDRRGAIDTDNIDAIRQNGQRRKQQQSLCKRCGGSHSKDNSSCPAREDRCYKCHKLGDWGRVCLQKPQGTPSNTPTRDTRRNRRQFRGHQGGQTQQVHNIDANDDPYDSTGYDEFETLEYNTIMVPVASVADNKQQRKEVFAKVDIRLPGRNDRVRRILNMKVDTGAMGSTLPLRIFRQIMPERTNADGTPDKRQITQVKNTTLIAYNNTKIDCYGTIDLHCKYRDTDWAGRKFYIVDVPGPAVCGLPMAEALGLVTIHCSVEMPICKVTIVKSLEDLKRIYGNQFDRIGNLPGKVKIMLKEGAIPFIDPPRK